MILHCDSFWALTEKHLPFFFCTYTYVDERMETPATQDLASGETTGETPSSTTEKLATTPSKPPTKLSKLLASVGANSSTDSASLSTATPSPTKSRTVTAVGAEQKVKKEGGEKEGHAGDDVLKGVKFGEEALSAMQVQDKMHCAVRKKTTHRY